MAATKTVLGLDPDVSFAVDDVALAHARDVSRRGRERRDAWLTTFDEWRAAHPDAAAELDRMGRREFPPGWEKDLPRYEPAARWPPGRRPGR